jgi:hypothetical protein
VVSNDELRVSEKLEVDFAKDGSDIRLVAEDGGVGSSIKISQRNL